MLIHEKHGYGVKRQNTCYYMRNMDMESQDKHMLIHEKHGYGVARQNTCYYMRNMDMESQDEPWMRHNVTKLNLDINIQ